MTITASRITAGTTQHDDHHIIDELGYRYAQALIDHPGAFDKRPAKLKREYTKASLRYHAKWSGAQVHA